MIDKPLHGVPVFEYRHTFSILGFIVFSIGLCSFALSVSERDAFSQLENILQKTEGKAQKFQVSRFERADYYLLQNGRRNFHLLADTLAIYPDGDRVRFIRPHGNVFSDDGDATSYKAEWGLLKQADRFLSLEGKVVLRSKDFQIATHQLQYHLNDDRIEASGGVDGHNLYARGEDRIFLRGEKAIFWPRQKRAQYSGKVLGRIERKLAYQSEMRFGSDWLNFDRMEEKISAEGHLWIQKRGVRARGRRGEIYLARPAEQALALANPAKSLKKGEKIKYFVLYDDIRVVEAVKIRGQTFERQAFCEQLEGQFDGHEIVLTGNPRVVQLGSEGKKTMSENSVIRGKQIILRENSEMVEIDDADTRFEVGP